MNFVAVAVVSAIVFGHPFNKSHVLIGLNCILLCLNNSSQIAKFLSFNASMYYLIRIPKTKFFVIPHMVTLAASKQQYTHFSEQAT